MPLLLCLSFPADLFITIFVFVVDKGIVFSARVQRYLRLYFRLKFIYISVYIYRYFFSFSEQCTYYCLYYLDYICLIT